MGAFACIGLLSCAQHDIGQAASEIASASGDDVYPGDPEAQKRADAVVAFLANSTATSGFCTGTLIAAEWVLTAAHCVRSNFNWNDVRVFIGSSLSTPTPARQYRVASCREHPSAYPVAASTTGNPPGCGGGGGDVEYRRFDVALVHLTVQSGVDQPTKNWAVPMPVLTNVARPAGIFPAKWEYEPVQLVGWGRLGSFGDSPETSVRQRGTNRINVYQQGTVAKFSQTFELVPTPIGGLGLASATPGNGDSGGPLLWLDRMFTNRPAVIAVTSGGNFIATGPRQTGPEGYAPTVLSGAVLNDSTRVAPGDWIEQQMNDGPPLAAGQAAIRWLSEPTGTEDNCPLVRNPDQTDSDGDKLGDACDPTPLFAEDEQQRLYGYPRYRLYPLGQQGVRMYACADRAAESEGGRQILEFDAPGPCARVHFMNVPSRLTKTVIGGLCTVGGNKIQIAYDPVRNASDPRAATVQNGVALRRCACWNRQANAPYDNAEQCYESSDACRNNGVLRRHGATAQGTGWLFEYTPVPALPLTAFESVRTYYRSMDSIEFDGSIWNLVPRLIPRFSFSSADSLLRYAAWRTEIGGAPALEFDWRGYDLMHPLMQPWRKPGQA